MIVDSSAVMAILLLEADAEHFARAMAPRTDLRMSAGTLIELTAVIVRRIPELADIEPERSIADLRCEIVPVTLAQAHLAQAAYREFGGGTGHAAKLNFGDCFAYALAKTTGEKLLFKGDDFTHTDLIRAR